MTAFSKAEKRLIDDEGWRDRPYKDTKGNLTIGIGFNLKDPSMAKEIDISKFTGDRKLPWDEAVRVFRKRYGVAHDDVRKFIGGKAFDSLSENQKDALVNMSYNMGTREDDSKGGIRSFKKMRSAILAKNFKKAALEVLDSDYARTNKDRAKRNADLMRGDADEVEQEVERQLN